MVISKNRIKHILKYKNRKQSKKKIKKIKNKKYNSFRKKKKNLRIHTIKNDNKKPKRKAKRKAKRIKSYIHKDGHNKKTNLIIYKDTFKISNNLNKYILPTINEEENLFQIGGDTLQNKAIEDANNDTEEVTEEVTNNDTEEVTNNDTELKPGKFGKFFEIGFLFNSSENLNITVLSDEDV